MLSQTGTPAGDWFSVTKFSVSAFLLRKLFLFLCLWTFPLTPSTIGWNTPHDHNFYKSGQPLCRIPTRAPASQRSTVVRVRYFGVIIRTCQPFCLSTKNHSLFLFFLFSFFFYFFLQGDQLIDYYTIYISRTYVREEEVRLGDQRV